jgi:uncharacterized protein (DUF2141 family)
MFSSATSSRLLSRFKALALFASALLVGGLLSVGFATSASATTPTTFNLTVHASNGAPQSEVEVILYTYNSEFQDWEQATNSSGDSDPYDLDTNSNGVVSFPITAGAKYSAFVSPDLAGSEGYGGYEIGKTTHVNPDFNGATGATGTFFVAVAGTNTASVTLAAGVTVSGNIFGPDGTTPNSDAYDVTAYRKTATVYGTQWVWVTEQGLNQGTDTSYSIDGLAPGNYAFQAAQAVDGGLAGNAFNDAASTADAAVPTIVGTGDTTQDITFAPAVSISGSVDLNGFTNESDNSEVQVQASPVDAEGDDISGDGFPSYSTEADPSGNYVLPVASGNYKVEFSPQNDAEDLGFFEGWYNNVGSEQTATVVHATSDQTLATQTLGQGFGISGSVTITDGSSASGFLATANDAEDPDNTQNVQVADDGTYSFTHLVPGKYTVDVADVNDDNYADTYYTGSTTPFGATYSYQAANLSGNATDFTGVNIEFRPAATLTVSVTNANGTPATNLDVFAEPVKDGQLDYSASAAPSEDATPVPGHSGTYELTQLQQGVSYAIGLASSENPAIDLQYLGGSDNAGSSDLFTPEQASSTLSTSLRANSSLTGTVTSSANKAVANVYVQLLEFDGTNWVDQGVAGQTNAKGVYSFTNLPTGSYRVQYTSAFDNLPYLTTYSGGVSTLDAATSVYVSAGHPAVVNTHLLAAGTISGTVAGGAAAGQIDIQPVTLAGTPGNFSYGSQDTGIEISTGSTGKFILSGLATGYYALTYQDENGVYGDSYADPATLPKSLIYKVIAGATTNAGTVTLPLASSAPAQVAVSAHLTGSTLSDPEGYINLTADNNGVDGGDLTANGDGTFSGSVAPGNYTYTTEITDDGNPTIPLTTVTGAVNVLPDGSTDFGIDEQAVAPLAFSTAASVTGSDSSVGTTYAVEDINVNRDGLTPTYQWFRGTQSGTSHAIFGATQGTYTSEGGDLGQGLFVCITVADGYPSFSIEETASEYVPVAIDSVTPSDQLTNTVQPTIDSSTGKVGVALHASPGTWNGISGAAYSYVWSSDRDGTEVVVGTNSPTYIPVAADAGDSISVAVTATKVGFTTQLAATSSNTAAIALLGTLTVKTAPKTTSKAGSGLTTGDTTFTTTPGTWSVAGAYSYQWSVNGQPVSGATSSSFLFNPAQFDPFGSTAGVTVQVTNSPAGYAPVTTTVVAKLDTINIDVVGTPSWLSDSETGGQVVPPSGPNPTRVPVSVGSVLTVPTNNDYVYPDDETSPTQYTYQWQRETSGTWQNIAGATKSSYTVTTADVGHPLQVLVIASSPTHAAHDTGFGYGGSGATNADLVNYPATVTLSGLGTPLTKMTGTVGTWGTPAGGTSTGVTDSYQWWICSANCDTFSATGGTAASGYTAIPKATASSYTPTDAQKSHTLVLRVAGSKAGYTTGFATSPGIQLGYLLDLVNGASTVPTTGTAALTKITGTPSTTWDGVTAVTNTYQWYICATDCDNFGVGTTADGYTAIAKATANSYTPTAAQAGDSLILVVRGAKVGYLDGYESSNPVLVTSGVITVTAPASITGLVAGAALFGTKLTAKPATVDVAGTTATYAWEVLDDSDSWVAAHGTTPTASTYTPVLADYSPGTGLKIRLEETIKKTGYGNQVSDSIQFPLVGSIPVPTVKPSITAVAGGWTIKPGTWPTVGGVGTPSYQWSIDNQASSTGPNQDNPGTSHAVTVTETWSGGAAYAPATYTIVVQKGTAIPAIGGMDIQGTPKFGAGALNVNGELEDFFATPGSSDQTATMTYQWYTGTTTATTAIAGATSASFTPTTAYIGKKLFAKLTLTSPLYATSTYITPGVTFTAGDGILGFPVLSYATTVHPGATIGVTLGSLPAGVTHGYQWLFQAPGASTLTAIAGATKATYVVTAAQLGGQLAVAVTNIKAGYLTIGDDSPSEVVVQPAVLAPITVPTIAGPAGATAAGTTLTVSTGTWNVTGTTFTYRWLRNGVALPGVTTATYALTGEDSGDEIQAEVTGHVAGYSNAIVTTNTVRATDGAAPKATTATKVTGAALQGVTLTATTGVWSLDGLTFSYQWFEGTSLLTGTAIADATSSTYALQSSDTGQHVWVVVTATRDGYAAGTSTSLLTAAVLGAP